MQSNANTMLMLNYSEYYYTENLLNKMIKGI